MANLHTASIASDPWGNEGYVADASWAARWTRYSSEDVDELTADAARLPFLSVVQMEHLIQGFPPPPHSWSDLATCLSGNLPTVSRLREDIKNGVLSRAPTPYEFWRWCIRWQVVLADSFLGAIIKSRGRRKTRKSVVLNPTLPPGVPITATTRRRGRPPSAAPRDDVLIHDGGEILQKAAETGVILTARSVAKRLQHTPCGQGLSVPSLERILRGRLHLDKARATAVS